MIAALRTEYRKLVTTRTWWMLLTVMAAVLLLSAAGMAVLLHVVATGGGDSDIDPSLLTDRVIATSVYSLGTTFGYLFPLVVGTLLVTNEFRHQLLTPSLLSEPSRDRLVVAKLGAAFAVGLVFGAVSSLVTVGGGAATLAALGEDPLLGDSEVVRGALLSVLALAMWAALGVGLGLLLPNQVAAVVVIIGFNQLVEPVLRTFLPLWSPAAGIPKFLPGAAGDALAGGSTYALTGSPADLLTWWQGLLVLAGYVAVLAVLGRVTTLRRDVT